MFSTRITVSGASGGTCRLSSANMTFTGGAFQKVKEKPMTHSRSFSRYFAPGVLVACVISLVVPCAAQEVDVPTNARGSGSVTAPSGWVELITPIQQRVDLKLYGFY